MSTFEITIEPFKDYCKYASQDIVLCGISFNFLDDEKHCFHSECSNKCLLEILSAIDDYFNGKIGRNTELYYDVPYVVGEAIYYPFSFKINVKEKQWIFRYGNRTNSSNFEFVFEMDERDIRSMRSQIESEYSKIDWQSLGKAELYIFDLPSKSFEWCYSAKVFNNLLSELCVGKKIKSIFVSATNYSGPLKVSENFVNYYIGSEIFIQLEGVLLNILIFASGLFKWRVFDNSEASIIGPRFDFIQDGDKEFCNIKDVYNAFKLDYQNSKIKEVAIQDTDYWPWSARGFDESQLTDPIELPEEIFFKLENGNTLSFAGWDDDFVIKIKG